MSSEASSPSRRVATITDVARTARVSPATVSRALNGSGTVSPARAARVHAAAARLGYRPNTSARALRRRHTRVWAAIIADIENRFFTAVVRGVEDAARGEDYRLVLCNSDEDLEREASYVDIVLAERMAGVVVAVASTTDSTLAALVEHRVPVVAIDRRPVGQDVDSVGVDNRRGAELATEHLIAGGSTRIACITGPGRVDTAVDRLRGYRDALGAAALPFDRALVRRADFKLEGGYRAARSLLESARRPDALFVANEPMAAGALRAVRDLGLRIPHDLAMVGFDDAPWMTLTDPELTVVAQPAYEIGRAAAELLLTAGDAQSARHLVLAPTLVARGSSIRSRLLDQ